MPKDQWAEIEWTALNIFLNGHMAYQRFSCISEIAFIEIMLHFFPSCPYGTLANPWGTVGSCCQKSGLPLDGFGMAWGGGITTGKVGDMTPPPKKKCWWACFCTPFLPGRSKLMNYDENCRILLLMMKKKTPSRVEFCWKIWTIWLFYSCHFFSLAIFGTFCHLF